MGIKEAFTHKEAFKFELIYYEFLRIINNAKS
jgi:hypothetical protein